ncbi:hypothetical protein YC2023_042108 [Brassica napus]
MKKSLLNILLFCKCDSTMPIMDTSSCSYLLERILSFANQCFKLVRLVFFMPFQLCARRESQPKPISFFTGK